MGYTIKLAFQLAWFVNIAKRGTLTFQTERYKKKKNFHRKKWRVNKKKLFSQQTIVVNELGMHARPAAKIAQMAMEGSGDIWLFDGASTVDASSIIDILTLGASKGTHISIQAESVEDMGLVGQIKAFFDIGFGELENE